ncbi:MAG TPA: hypothetical protein VFA74_19375 [Terriglobales bacterium]|nr:hypothetical protein [Terriglobales bacterium]
MFGERGSSSPELVIGIFCEPFNATSAIAELLGHGFTDDDIDALGVLEGHAPYTSDFWLAIGLPSEVAAFCSACFDDGAVLVMIRIDPTRKREKIAIELVKHYGGVCSVTNSNHIGVSDSFFERSGEAHRKEGNL